MERLITFCVLLCLSSLVATLPFPEAFPGGYEYEQHPYERYNNFPQPQTFGQRPQYGQVKNYQSAEPEYVGNSYGVSTNAARNYHELESPTPPRQPFIPRAPTQQQIQEQIEEQIQQQHALNGRLTNSPTPPRQPYIPRRPTQQQIQEQIEEQIQQQHALSERLTNSPTPPRQPFIPHAPSQQQIQEQIEEQIQQQHALNERLTNGMRAQNVQSNQVLHSAEPYVPSAPVSHLKPAYIYEQQLPGVQAPTRQWQNSHVAYEQNPIAQSHSAVNEYSAPESTPQTVNPYQKIYRHLTQEPRPSNGANPQIWQNLWSKYADSKAPPKHEKRYLVIHPDGSTEYVDKIDSIAQKHPNYMLINKGSIGPNVAPSVLNSPISGAPAPGTPLPTEPGVAPVSHAGPAPVVGAPTGYTQAASVQVAPAPAAPAPASPSQAASAPATPVQPAPAQPVPVPAQPASVQPAPAQPVPAPAQPAPAQPAPTQPAPTQPAPTQPAPAQPAPTQPAPAQQALAQPVPAAAQPATAQSVTTQTAPAPPAPAQPAPTQPAPVPAPAQPSAAQPTPAPPASAQTNPAPAQLAPAPAQPAPAQPASAPAKPGPVPAQPSPAQPAPAPAQPAPVQSTPAQPATAQAAATSTASVPSDSTSVAPTPNTAVANPQKSQIFYLGSPTDTSAPKPVDSAIVRKILNGGKAKLNDDDQSDEQVIFFLVEPQPVVVEVIHDTKFPNGTIHRRIHISTQENKHSPPVTVSVTNEYIEPEQA